MGQVLSFKEVTLDHPGCSEGLPGKKSTLRGNGSLLLDVPARSSMPGHFLA